MLRSDLWKPNYNETKRVMKVKKPPLKKKPTSKLVQVHQEGKIKPRVEANKRFIVEKPMEQKYEIKSKNREINSKNATICFIRSPFPFMYSCKHCT